jgi:hypothetical protein
MNFWIANLHLFLFIYDLFQDAAVFRMTGLLMNDLERICKEAVMAQFKGIIPAVT